MGEIEKLLNRIYELYSNGDNQYFVALQKAYVLAFREYCKDFTESNHEDKKTKEYIFFKEILENIGLSSEELFLFQKIWRIAEDIKKRDTGGTEKAKERSFSVDDALMQLPDRKSVV